jgi:ribonuclease HI
MSSYSILNFFPPIKPNTNNYNTHILKIKKTSNPICPANNYKLHFDGCSKGNPGPSGIGAVLYNNNEEIWCDYKYIGVNCTNNEAEYQSLILGLEEAVSQNITKLSVYGDSQLVINQLNGVYKVKKDKLRPFYEKIHDLINHFEHIDFTHVYREENKRADALSNMALNGVACNKF